MRKQFEAWFPIPNPLRALAADIASTDCQSGEANGFHPPLYNFLANGDTTVSKSPPPFLPIANCPMEIAKWKFDVSSPSCCQKHGFDDKESMSKRGLSLLFDPLVDAFIFANYKHGISTVIKKRTLIVITDYGPILDHSINLEHPGNPKDSNPIHDWAIKETATVFNSHKNHSCKRQKPVRWKRDSTTENLMACLCGAHWKTSIIASHDVWVWNFVPFLRCGNYASGMGGLPSTHNIEWIKQCMKWLIQFISHIQPTQIAWCTSGDIRELSLGKKFIAGNINYTYPSLFGSRNLRVFNHPGSKNWPVMDCPNMKNYI